MKTKVKDLLLAKGSNVFSTTPEATLGDVIRILNDKHIGALMVLKENGEIQGIITERDIMMKMAQVSGDVTDIFVKIVMTPKEKLIIGTENDTLEYLMNIMTANRIRHIPIVNQQSELKGIISIGDCVKSLMHDTKYENKLLKDYIETKYPI